jgi:hypothetical protein
MTFKGKIDSIRRYLSIIKDILQAKNVEQLRVKIKTLDQRQAELRDKIEVNDFISHLKKDSIYSIETNEEPTINRLCQDWENREIKGIIYEFQNAKSVSYIQRKDWIIPTGSKIVSMRTPGCIHRKDWEWALGVIAMRKFNKLNKNSNAIGIGVGREEVIFYPSKTED